MVRRILYTLMLCVLTLTACITESYVPDSQECTGGEGPWYLSLVLAPQGDVAVETKGTSPSPQYKRADIEESLVSNVDLFFYSGSGAYMGNKHITNVEQVRQGDGASVENVAGAIVVSLDYRPWRMLVTVNLEAAQANALKDKDLEAASALVLGSAWRQASAVTVPYGGTNYSIQPMFMSSSSYITKGGRKACDVVIGDRYVHETASAAKNAPVEVCVDRLASKVTLRVKKISHPVPVVTAADNIKATVDILGWGLNATNKSAYYFKNIDPSWSFSWAWNNPSHQRSYWAKDPNYDEDDDNFSCPTKPSVVSSSDPYNYVSWSALDGTLTLKDGYYSGDAYCLENTSDGRWLPVSDNSLRTLYPRITHILVKAKLSFSVSSGTDAYGYTTEKDFFRYKGAFYTKAKLIEAVLRDQATAGTRYYTDAAASTPATVANFALVHNGGGSMSVSILGTLYKKVGSAAPVECQSSELFNIPVTGYHNGMMYYKIPVEHLNNDKPTGTTYPTGTFGTLRNHNYVVTSDNLSGMGNGVWEDSEAIVPVRGNDDYMVSVYTSVSPWQQLEHRFLFYDPTGQIVFGPVITGQEINRWDDTSGAYE